MKNKNSIKKLTGILLLLVLMMSFTVGGAYAYLHWNDSLQNSFTYESSVTPDVKENFSGSEKTNVYVNVGDTGYSVYVRAAVLINWKNEAGEVLANIPELTNDYEIQYNLTDSDWFDGGDGFYYFANPVNSLGNTDILISKCVEVDDSPIDGYKLNVDIVTQTIQSAGFTDAGVPLVTEAWKVTVNSDKTISK